MSAHSPLRADDIQPGMLVCYIEQNSDEIKDIGLVKRTVWNGSNRLFWVFWARQPRGFPEGDEHFLSRPHVHPTVCLLSAPPESL